MLITQIGKKPSKRKPETLSSSPEAENIQTGGALGQQGGAGKSSG